MFGISMVYNGPVIWRCCVTRRKYRAVSSYFSQKVVTVRGGYGAFFAVREQILLSITRVAVHVRSKPVNYHGTGFFLGVLEQCRDIYYLGASNLSRCRILIAGR